MEKSENNVVTPLLKSTKEWVKENFHYERDKITPNISTPTPLDPQKSALNSLKEHELVDLESANKGEDKVKTSEVSANGKNCDTSNPVTCSSEDNASINLGLVAGPDEAVVNSSKDGPPEVIE